jgi:hypothetical protein
VDLDKINKVVKAQFHRAQCMSANLSAHFDHKDVEIAKIRTMGQEGLKEEEENEKRKGGRTKKL